MKEQIIQYLELQIQDCERQRIQYNLDNAWRFADMARYEAGAYKDVLDYIKNMGKEGTE